MNSETEFSQILRRSIREGLVVQIGYISRYRGYPDHTVRKIEPLELDGRIVRAYCRLREDERHFRIDRIRGLELTGESFSPRAEVRQTAPRKPSASTRRSSNRSDAGCLTVVVALAGSLAVVL